MPVTVDVPDLDVLAGELARPHDGPRIPLPEALLKEARIENACIEERLGGRPEVPVINRIEDERRSLCGIKCHGQPLPGAR